MYVYNKRSKIIKKNSELINLVISLLRVFPKHTTVNRFKEPPLSLPKNQEKKTQKLFKMLVHSSTLINENYRTKDKQGRYLSQKEDYVNALNLMKDIILYFDTKKGSYEHEILALLQILQEKKGEISNKYLQEFTGYSRSNCKRIITLFFDRNWIKRTGGNRKTGYTYLLVE